MSFVWQQIFRKYIELTYNPTEVDLLRAIHNVIDHCQDSKLRGKVSSFISDKTFSQKLVKWYKNISKE